MENEYNYYLKIIKPIEKKYNRLCILYSIFHFKYFKNKKKLYNLLLIKYYRLLQENTNYANKLEEKLNKKNSLK